MQLISIQGIIFFIGLGAAASTSNNNKDDLLVVSRNLLNNGHIIYTSEYDIVSLTVPLNSVNLIKHTDESNTGIQLYFVEADINEKGQKEYKGLYSLKNGKANKILESGTDASVADDGTEKVYISAKDGIYLVDATTNKTEKYGTVTDSLIGIVKTKGSDLLYVLTEDHHVYKVTNNANKKEKLQDVKYAHQIVLDYSNNLYFYGKDKVPHVVTEEGVKKIVGTPENPSYALLIKPPALVENGTIFTADDKFYIIYVNGTSKATDFTLPVKPTAFTPEANVIQYYSYKKKIYERNFIQPGLDLLYDLALNFAANKYKYNVCSVGDHRYT